MRYVYSVLMVMLILAPLPAQADMVLELERIRPANYSGYFHSTPGGFKGFGHYPHGHLRFRQFHLQNEPRILYSATRIYQI